MNNEFDDIKELNLMTCTVRHPNVVTAAVMTKRTYGRYKEKPFQANNNLLV